MGVIGILLIILCSILGTGLILSTVGFFYFRNKWKKRKELNEEKRAAELYEKLINEEDEKLREEIEEATNEFNSKDSAVSDYSKKKLKKKNASDSLYSKCENFVKKWTKIATHFIYKWERIEQKDSEKILKII